MDWVALREKIPAGIKKYKYGFLCMYLLAVVLYNFLNQSLEGSIFMNERIRKLTELTLKGEMYAHPTKTEYDREDLFLSRQQMESKRLCEFILNQQPVLTLSRYFPENHCSLK